MEQLPSGWSADGRRTHCLCCLFELADERWLAAYKIFDESNRCSEFSILQDDYWLDISIDSRPYLL